MSKIDYNYTQNILIYKCNIDKYTAQHIIQLILNEEKDYWKNILDTAIAWASVLPSGWIRPRFREDYKLKQYDYVDHVDEKYIRFKIKRTKYFRRILEKNKVKFNKYYSDLFKRLSS